MLQERIEQRFVDAFVRTFRDCAVEAGTEAAILSESQSRPVNVRLAELALQQLGARVVHVVVPTPPEGAPVPVRSTGATKAIGGSPGAIAALQAVEFVADCTVEGMLHARELPEILGAGTRVLMVSNEHPEALERTVPDPALKPKVLAGIKRLKNASEMRVTSAMGTDLTVDVSRAPAGGGWGTCDRPGQISHWPGGLCLCFPAPESVNGRLVLAPGDVNLTFKRYVESPVVLSIEKDYVTEIEGAGLDATLFREYMAAWGDREAYAVSHVGWGMNPAARWEAMALYDKADFNGTELRAFAGNFLYSTGANETAGRYTEGHFDLPMRGCTVVLDGETIVEAGRLQGEFA